MQSISINEKVIYALFTRHLSDEPVRVGRLINEFKRGNIKTKRQALEGFNQILLDHQDTVQSERKDVLQITRLAQSVELNWLGVELSVEELYPISKSVARYLKAKTDIENIAQGEPDLWWAEKTDQILHLFSSERVIVHVKNPQMFDSIKTVALEDIDLRSAQFAVTKKRYIRRNNLMQIALRGLLTPEQLIHVFTVAMDSLENGERILHPQHADLLVEMGQTEDDFVVHSLVEAYIKAINESIDVLLKRDEVVAHSALEAQGNGLILMGSGHEKGVKKNLIQACEAHL